MEAERARPPSHTTAAASRPSDRKIEAAIHERLARAGDIPASLITVHVRDGIASLEGQVNRGVERSRASDIAEGTRGVRALVNRLEVKPGDRVGQALEQAVSNTIKAESPRVYANVRVTAQGHQVVLSGSVPQAASKEEAEKLAWYVPGVTEVENQIAVVPGYTRSDDEIRAEVTRNLRADPYVGNDPVSASVQNGSVQLKGTVGSAFEKRRAHSTAQVPGVVEVQDDDVQVVPQVREAVRYTAAPLTDAESQAAIRDAFAADPRLPKGTVDFDVKYGVVTLSGVVGSLAQKLAAGEDARRAIGVSGVINELQIRSWADSRATSVEQRVLQRLREHPYVDARQVHVQTDGNAILLEGRVGSQFERTTAERVAASVPGVAAITNRLSADRTPPNYRNDDDIRAEVQRALYWDRRVGDANVSVTVNEGIVTLRGQVSNPEIYDAVLEDVFELSPKGLINQLSLPASQRAQAMQ